MFSIVIPSYNHAKYIGKCIKSILDQDFKYWEIILVDNNSTDNTDEVLKKYTDNRIKIFKINNDGVIAKSRNFGIKNAKYEWIAFLDSDDTWRSNKLELCFKKINENKDVDVLYHDMKIRYEKKNYFLPKKLRSKNLTKPVINKLLTYGNVIALSSTVVRKEIIIKANYSSTDKNKVGACDYALWLRIAKLTENFIHLPVSLGTYYKHSSNVSNKDMSDVTLNVVAPYLHILNRREKNLVISKVYYIKSKFKFLSNAFKYKDFNSIHFFNLSFSLQIKFVYFFLKSYLSLCLHRKLTL